MKFDKDNVMIFSMVFSCLVLIIILLTFINNVLSDKQKECMSIKTVTISCNPYNLKVLGEKECRAIFQVGNTSINYTGTYDIYLFK